MNFKGGDISSDGGLLLLSELDKKLGLTADYEDLNDHNHLNGDPLFQAINGRDAALAGASTLSRFENGIQVLKVES